MNIYLREGAAFIDLGQGYLLCIGTKEEVDKAEPQKLVEMVQVAIAVSRYQSIQNTRKLTLH